MRKSAPLFCALLLSLSARRAWIEIAVDSASGTLSDVALRKESVDRNPPIWTLTTHKIVALRKESVDRNFQVCTIAGRLFQSLSARRAWIEITVLLVPYSVPRVALRKESVDRNFPVNPCWNVHIVALRKESVDRNRR